MALINCWECGKEVSRQAAACPHCGAPSEQAKKAAREAPKRERPRSQNMGCGTIVVLAVVLFLVYSMFPGLDAPAPARPTPAKQTASAELQLAANIKFAGMPGISQAEWLDGDFIIGATDNGSSWQPVADSACAWLRQQGAPAGIAVVVLEASALRNKRWSQLARARCR